MLKKGEIIHLHIGQAGVQIANACWELYCLEHGIDASGCMYECPRDESFKTFFAFSKTPKVVPRLVMVDSEPTVIDEVRTGTYGKLYKPETLITGKEDSGSNFARGFYTLSAELIEPTMESLRCVAESCCNLKGFLVFRSIGGGTGSGLGDCLMEHIADEYGKLAKLDFIIFPSPSISPLIVEPYNSILSTHIGMDSNECTFILDNQALYDICETKLEVRNPTYTNLNRIIGQAISGLTASLRFRGSTNVNLTEFQTNLVPYPRIHFPLVSYAPLVTMYSSYYTELSTEQLTYESFQASNQLVRCNPAEGKYMSCVLLYRGNIAPADINASIQHLKDKGTFRFVDWSPTGFKIGINSMPPCPVLGGDVGVTDRAVMALSNNSIIKKAWCRLLKKYNNLFQRRAFIHHFLSEGLEEDMFTEASEDICSLIGDYCEVESNKPPAKVPAIQSNVGYSSDSDSSRHPKPQNQSVNCYCQCKVLPRGNKKSESSSSQSSSTEFIEDCRAPRNNDCPTNEKPSTIPDKLCQKEPNSRNKNSNRPGLPQTEHNMRNKNSNRPGLPPRASSFHQSADTDNCASENSLRTLTSYPPSSAERNKHKTPKDGGCRNVQQPQTECTCEELHSKECGSCVVVKCKVNNKGDRASSKPRKSLTSSRSLTVFNTQKKNSNRPRLPQRARSFHKIPDTANRVANKRSRSLTPCPPSSAERKGHKTSRDEGRATVQRPQTQRTTANLPFKGCGQRPMGCHNAADTDNREGNKYSRSSKPRPHSSTERKGHESSCDAAQAWLKCLDQTPPPIVKRPQTERTNEDICCKECCSCVVVKCKVNNNRDRASSKPMKSPTYRRSQTESNIRNRTSNRPGLPPRAMSFHKIPDTDNGVANKYSRSSTPRPPSSAERKGHKTSRDEGRATVQRPQTQRTTENLPFKGCGRMPMRCHKTADTDNREGNKYSRSSKPRPHSSTERKGHESSCDAAQAWLKCLEQTPPPIVKRPQTERTNEDICCKECCSCVVVKCKVNNNRDRASSKPMKSPTQRRSQTESNIRNRTSNRPGLPPRAMSFHKIPDTDNRVANKYSRSSTPRPPSSTERKGHKTSRDEGRATVQRPQTQRTTENLPFKGCGRMPMRCHKTADTDNREGNKYSRSSKPRPHSSTERKGHESSCDAARAWLKCLEQTPPPIVQRPQTERTNEDICCKECCSCVVVKCKCNNNRDRGSSKPMKSPNQTESNIRNRNSNRPGLLPKAKSFHKLPHTGNRQSSTPRPPSSAEQKGHKTSRDEGRATIQRPQTQRTTENLPFKGCGRMPMRCHKTADTDNREGNKYSQSSKPRPPSSTERKGHESSCDAARAWLKCLEQTPPPIVQRPQTERTTEDILCKKCCPCVVIKCKCNNNRDPASSKPMNSPTHRRSQTEFNIRNKNSNRPGLLSKAKSFHKIPGTDNRVANKVSRSSTLCPPSSTELKGHKTPYNGGRATDQRPQTEHTNKNLPFKGCGQMPMGCHKTVDTDNRVANKFSQSSKPGPPASTERKGHASSCDAARAWLKCLEQTPPPIVQRPQTEGTNEDILCKKCCSCVVIKCKCNNDRDPASSKPMKSPTHRRSQTEFNIRNSNSIRPGLLPKAKSFHKIPGTDNRVANKVSRSSTLCPPSSTELKGHKTPYNGGRATDQRAQTEHTNKNLPFKGCGQMPMGCHKTVDTDNRVANKFSQSSKPGPPSSTERKGHASSCDAARAWLKCLEQTPPPIVQRPQTEGTNEDILCKKCCSCVVIKCKCNNNRDPASSKPMNSPTHRRSQTEFNIRNSNSIRPGLLPKAKSFHKIPGTDNRVANKVSRSSTLCPPSSTELKGHKTPYDGGRATDQRPQTERTNKNLPFKGCGQMPMGCHKTADIDNRVENQFSRSATLYPTSSRERKAHENSCDAARAWLNCLEQTTQPSVQWSTECTSENIQPKRSVSRVAVKCTHKISNNEGQASSKSLKSALSRSQTEYNIRNKNLNTPGLPLIAKSCHKVTDNRVSENPSRNSQNGFHASLKSFKSPIVQRSRPERTIEGICSQRSVSRVVVKDTHKINNNTTNQSNRSVPSTASKSSHKISSSEDRSHTKLNIRNIKSDGAGLCSKEKKLQKISALVACQPPQTKLKQIPNDRGRSPSLQSSQTNRSIPKICSKCECGSLPKPLKSETLRQSQTLLIIRNANCDEAELPPGSRTSHTIADPDDDPNSTESLILHRCEAKLNLRNEDSERNRLRPSESFDYFQTDRSEQSVSSSMAKRSLNNNDGDHSSSKYSQRELMNNRSCQAEIINADDSDSSHSTQEVTEQRLLSRTGSNICIINTHRKGLADRMSASNSEYNPYYNLKDYTLQHLYNEDIPLRPRFRIYPEMSNKKHCSTQTIRQVESIEFTLNQCLTSCQNISNDGADLMPSSLASSTLIRAINLNEDERSKVNAKSKKPHKIDKNDDCSSRKPTRSRSRPSPLQRQRSIPDRTSKGQNQIPKSKSSSKNDFKTERRIRSQAGSNTDNFNSQGSGLHTSKQSCHQAANAEEHASFQRERSIPNRSSEGQRQIPKSKRSSKNDFKTERRIRSQAGSNTDNFNSQGSGLHTSKQSCHQSANAEDRTSRKPLQSCENYNRSGILSSEMSSTLTNPSRSLASNHTQGDPDRLDINSERQEHISKSKSYIKIEDCENADLQIQLKSPKHSPKGSGPDKSGSKDSATYYSQIEPGQYDIHFDGCGGMIFKSKSYKKIDNCGDFDVPKHLKSSKLLCSGTEFNSRHIDSNKSEPIPAEGCTIVHGYDRVSSKYTQLLVSHFSSQQDSNLSTMNPEGKSPDTTSKICKKIHKCGLDDSHGNVERVSRTKPLWKAKRFCLACAKSLQAFTSYVSQSDPCVPNVRSDMNGLSPRARSFYNIASGGANTSSKRLPDCFQLERNTRDNKSDETGLPLGAKDSQRIVNDCSRAESSISAINSEVNPRSTVSQNVSNSSGSFSPKRLTLSTQCCQINISIQDMHCKVDKRPSSAECSSKVIPGLNLSNNITNSEYSVSPKRLTLPTQRCQINISIQDMPSSAQYSHQSATDSRSPSELNPGSSLSHNITNSGCSASEKQLILPPRCSQTELIIQDISSKEDQRPTLAEHSHKSATDSKCSSEVNPGSSLSHNIPNSGCNVSEKQLTLPPRCSQAELSIQDINSKEDERPSCAKYSHKSATDSESSSEVNPGSNLSHNIPNSGFSVSKKQLSLPCLYSQTELSTQDINSKEDERPSCAEYSHKPATDSESSSEVNPGSSLAHNFPNSKCSVSRKQFTLPHLYSQTELSIQDINSKEDERPPCEEYSHKPATDSESSSEVNPGSNLSHNIPNSGFSVSKKQLSLPCLYSQAELSIEDINSKEDERPSCAEYSHKPATDSESSSEVNPGSSLAHNFPNSKCSVSSKQFTLPHLYSQTELSIQDINSKEDERPSCAEYSHKPATDSECSSEVNLGSNLSHNIPNSGLSVSKKQLSLPCLYSQTELSIQDINSKEDERPPCPEYSHKSATDSECSSEVYPGSSIAHNFPNSRCSVSKKQFTLPHLYSQTELSIQDIHSKEDERPSCTEYSHKSATDSECSSEVNPGSSLAHNFPNSGFSVSKKHLSLPCLYSQAELSIQEINSKDDEHSECSSELNPGSRLSPKRLKLPTECSQIELSILDIHSKEKEHSESSSEVNPGSNLAHNIPNSGYNVSLKRLSLPIQCSQIELSILDINSKEDEHSEYSLEVNPGSSLSHNITNSGSSVSENQVPLPHLCYQTELTIQDTNFNEDKRSSSTECSDRSANDSEYSSAKSQRSVRSDCSQTESTLVQTSPIPNQSYLNNNTLTHEFQPMGPRTRVSEIGILREHIALRRRLHIMTRIPPRNQLFIQNDTRAQESDQDQENPNDDVDNSPEYLSPISVDSGIIPRKSLKSTRLSSGINETTSSYQENEALPVVRPEGIRKFPEIPPLDLRSISSSDSIC